jgi:glycosyltransferase involved in cell wall biosynthesis
MNFSVSIIIPTRNRSEILSQCLRALPSGAEGFDTCEVIVVDDCSNDATGKTVEKFRNSTRWSIQWLQQNHPQGANAARNRGLSVARGEVIVLIDDDTFPTQGWLKKLLGGLCEEYPIVSGPAKIPLEGSLLGRHRQEVGSYLSEVLRPSIGLDGMTVPVSCNMAAFRWVFQQAQFDETVRPPCEEGDWLRRTGVRTRFVPEALVWHHKAPEEIKLRRLLRTAWSRGSEGGWWIRECAHIESRRVWLMAAQCVSTSMRAFGHALVRLCWGGVIVGVGELSRALALGGIINRGQRVPKSWR